MTSYTSTWIPLDDDTGDVMSIHNMPLYSHLCSVVPTPACGSALASASGSALASANVRPCITMLYTDTFIHVYHGTYMETRAYRKYKSRVPKQN